MPLCAACESITPRRLSEASSNGADGQPMADYIPHFVHSNIKELYECSSTCELCSLVLRQLYSRSAVRRSGSFNSVITDIPENEPIQLVRSSRSKEEGCLSLCTITVQCGSTKARISAFADPGTPAAVSGDVVGRSTRNPNSEESVSLIAQWLQDCTLHHDMCKLEYERKDGTTASKERGPDIPARVIDVGLRGSKTDDLRLIEAGKHIGPYAALSHRWSLDPMEHFKTVKDNINTRMTSFSKSSLPKTFRDAVTLTQDLGIQYLWIDSICILQDSESDWAEESAYMGEIYRRSHLVIAAISAATSPNRGFYFPREYDNPHPIRLHYIDSQGQKSGYWYIHGAGDFYNQVTDSELHRRGWVLQERWLSRRKIHFAVDQLYWECKAGIRSEILRDEPFNLPKLSLPQQLEDQTTVGFEDWIDSWVAMVSRYTLCDLTFPNDRLPALAGLARWYEHQLGSTYSAGLFAGWICFGLLWYPSSAAASARNSLAPSWSWASINGPITWILVTEQPGMAIENDESCSSLIDMEVHIVPDKVENPYGSVKYGRLTTTGWILPVSIQSAIKYHLHPSAFGRYGKKVYNTAGQALSWAFLDEVGRVLTKFDSAITSAWCLLVYTVIERGIEYGHALLIGATDLPDTFRRLGVCRLDTRHFRAAVRRRISII